MRRKFSWFIYFYCCAEICLVTLSGPRFALAEGPSSKKSLLISSSEIFDLFAHFLKDPSLENYSKTKSAIALSDYVDLRSDALQEGERLLNQDKFQEAVSLIDGPKGLGFLLVPRAHFILAASYRHLGQIEQADAEKGIAQLLLKTIAMSGEGTREKPYQLLNVEAENDFVGFFLKDKKTSQSLIPQGEKFYDVYQLASGKEIWFEVSERMKNFARNIQSQDAKKQSSSSK